MRSLARPTTVECYLSQIGFNVSVTFTYAPLLTRTNRIYRIFTVGRRAKKPPSLTSPLAQILIANVLILLQVCLKPSDVRCCHIGLCDSLYVHVPHSYWGRTVRGLMTA